MFKHLEGARLGLFIFLGTVLLVLSIFLIGGKESLFVNTITIKTNFKQVEGLKSGAPVRLSGYDVGSVSSIGLSTDSTGGVDVYMKIDNELRHFIRLDSEASIETEGLVGKKIITLTPGSQKMPVVSDGGIVRSTAPVSMAEIIAETQAIMANIEVLSKEFSDVFIKINKGEGTIGKLINDDQLYKATVNITRSADKSLTSMTKRLDEISAIILNLGDNLDNIVTNVDTAVFDIRTLVDNVQKGEGVLGALMTDKSAYDSIKAAIKNLVATTENANVGAIRFAENMEALKHNWLFKNYFEERGYWDVSEYQKEIDKKLEELKFQSEELERRRAELLELEKKLNFRTSSQ